MNRSYFFRFGLALVLVVILAGIGSLAFNAGVTRGLVLGTYAQTGQQPLIPPMVYGSPFMGSGFGFLGLLIPLFLVLLFFGALRGLMGGGHYRAGMRHPYGPWGSPPAGADAGRDAQRYSERDVPPFVEEWHRRMHAQQADETPEQAE